MFVFLDSFNVRGEAKNCLLESDDYRTECFFLRGVLLPQVSVALVCEFASVFSHPCKC